MLDSKYLVNLGGKTFVDEFKPVFKESCRSSLEKLDLCLENKNWVDVHQVIHKLIGTLKTFGANELSLFLINIKEKITEKNNQSSQLNLFRKKYADLEKYIDSDELRANLKAYKDSLNDTKN